MEGSAGGLQPHSFKMLRGLPRISRQTWQVASRHTEAQRVGTRVLDAKHAQLLILFIGLCEFPEGRQVLTLPLLACIAQDAAYCGCALAQALFNICLSTFRDS